MTVLRGALTTWPGRLFAVALASTLAVKSSGKIAAVYVAVAQQVTAGQPLVKIDTTDLENALAQAQSNLRSVQLNYGHAAANANDAQRTLEQTQQSTQNDIAAAQQTLAKLKT